ncbi:fumarylacetoacetate hydrolase family protein [Saccharopolyspora sp. NFXS83]|uniref:fumarylacetoacetate hydrolase family protein n=1 Tax=Saccharopolyspora sp. NFXS83 TaxID=2993560 RepID=UPI00224B6783|nr:fumarylacetoacetate hydrolase family protein [Saccharopolyspora sp. NFXS83]MCX2729352.1 fumarylacetoacetate hydrolase family protein [Saccharopolyspora sp. NFXS83]
MRFASYEVDGTTRAGVVGADGLHALPESATVLGLVRSGLPAALAAGAAALEGPAVPVERVRLLPPLEPPSVRDFVAFEEHVEGVVASVSGGGGVPPEWYGAPTFYFTNPAVLIGAHDDVPIPPGSRLFDFELEVAAVLGRDGASLSPQEARSAIFGYAIFNDWSARDLQAREMEVNLGPAKGKDSASTLGPWLVTADELEPRRDEDGFLALAMAVSVNGVEVGRDLLSNMGWPFEELVSYAARGSRIRAGDVFASGTCGNGGCLAELWGRRGERVPPPLRPGDVVEMTVEGIGTIRNTVRPATGLPPVRSARNRPRNRTRTR